MDLAQPEALDLLADLLANGAAVRVVVTGDSMRPFLRGGETVTLQRVNPAEIRCGDLALCQHAGGRLLLHRVVRIRRRDDGTVRIETQGDALRTPDEPVPESQVLGRGSEVARTRRSAELISLDTRWQRRRGLLVTLRQGTLWSSGLARARLHMLGAFQGLLLGSPSGLDQRDQRDSTQEPLPVLRDPARQPSGCTFGGEHELTLACIARAATDRHAPGDDPGYSRICSRP